MSEFDEFYNDEFFIIDSNNLDSINSKLYGFCIHNSKIIQNQEITHDFNFLDYGIFINVKVTEDEIKIYQDFNGSYGLYLFKQDDYFAISNSFWKLVEYLKVNYQLSVNNDFSKSVFLTGNMYAFSYKDTFVNEIELIPRNLIFHINKHNLSFYFEEINYEESTIELNSKEGLELLDLWFNKWINIVRNLKEETNNISFDLSEEISSRVILSILLNSNIDLEKVQINSLTDSNHHQKNLDTLNQISDEFGFKLNQDLSTSEKIYFNDLDTTINLSLYIKLGFNNDFNFNFFKYKNPIFSFNARGGNILKGLPLISRNNFSEDFVFSKLQNMFFTESSKNLIEKDLKTIEKVYKEDEKWITWRYNKETISRNHYGKDAVEEYFSNKLNFSPFFDPILNRLKLTIDECSDRKLLFVLILSRYCPKLLDFNFAGENFDFKIKEYVNSINKILPYEKVKNEFISGPKLKSNSLTNVEIHNYKELFDYLINVFHSDDFKNKFINKFNSFIYYKFVEQMDYSNPMKYFSTSFSLVKIIDDTNYPNFEYSKISGWIKNYIEDNNRDNNYINSNLLKFNRARIDLRNAGYKNNIELLEYSDDNLLVFKNWGREEKGFGLSINSQKNDLSLKIKCINKGTLKIMIKGPNFRNKYNEDVHVYIDFNYLSVNDRILLNSSKLVSFSDNYVYKIDVNDGEILDLKFKWLPLNYLSSVENINQDLKKMTERYENLRYKKDKRKAKLTAARNARSAIRAAVRAVDAAAKQSRLGENLLRNFPVSDEIIIEVDDVSMEFLLAEEKVDNFKEYFIRFLKRDLPEKTKFKALNHVSFKVHKGERLGVIGFNGAGKSTLLKILSGVMKPTEGKVTVKGGVAPLLELGAGFDINYTGEENIFLNGSILGYQKEFLEEKFDEIVEFSELGHFIKVPIKNYSSGMKAKLGFSVATIVNPDILILDEVLSVGDVKFKEKSKEKLEELMGEGVTVIMVTHSVGAIRKMCNKVIWLDQGNLIRYGDVDEICDEYIEFAKSGTQEDLKNIKLH
ncbi:ABC transporter ATP-binding protein [uncultured Methanobrevibacter sp.]|uniref:ABC transporter ATP-binding protein n=1 Tax=uncultured Methanobrevibacter sp. TaxID=253161 RepID=UPI0025EE268B|nr:ABC transporter ATP-binding protein [uncultured Methanobrevibacter sp.]